MKGEKIKKKKKKIMKKIGEDYIVLGICVIDIDVM